MKTEDEQAGRQVEKYVLSPEAQKSLMLPKNSVKTVGGNP